MSKVLSVSLAFILTLLWVLPRNTETAKPTFKPTLLTASAIRNDYSLELPKIGAESIAVIDAESRSLLFAKGAGIIRGMASTTKIMTALVAIENGNLNQEFAIPKEAVGIEGSSVYLAEGEKLTLLELLYCLLLESGNDAATAIAICVGGSVEEFVDLMNSKAEELGLKHTHFTNPHGLSDYEHHTTAQELAFITAEAMEYPIFRQITATKNFNVRRDGNENGRMLTNHNKLIGVYDGILGVKTGYTQRDGKCLVSAAERDGLRVIAVSLKDNSPTANHKILLDLAFEKFSKVRVAKAGEITATLPLNNGEKEFVTLCNTDEVWVCLPKGEKFQIELTIPETADAPVCEGEIFGEARVLSKGKEVYIINLEITETVKIKEKNFWERLFGK